MNGTNPEDKIIAERRWDAFIATIRRRKRRRRIAGTMVSFGLIAASVFVFLPRESAVVPVELAVESAAFVRTVVLPDGSLVQLSAGSSLFYPESFGDTREVRLLGEALFDVESSPEHPFLVHLNGGTITVTGTRFTATAYPGADDLKVALERGRVQLEVDGQEPIVIHPSQEIRINRVSGQATEKHLVFRDSRLEDIMDSVAAIYGVSYSLPESLKNTRLSLRLLQYDDISKVISLIGIACGINYAVAADGSLILTEQ